MTPWVWTTVVVAGLGLEVVRLRRRAGVARAEAAWRLREAGAEVARLAAANRADAAIVASLPDPVVVLGADHRVRRQNRAAQEAFGDDLAGVLRHPGLREAVDRVQAEGAGQAELSLAVPVKREITASVIPIDPPLQDGGTLLLVLSDRSRERALERMRADFVANASHELRTPLAGLIGFIDTLRGPAAEDRPAQARFLAIMAEQAGRMNRLIDDLLSLSRIEIAEHRAPQAAVRLQDVAASVAAGFEARLAERRMTLALDCPPGLPPVRGDADQLAQVVQNLMENALKYGRDGGGMLIGATDRISDPRWPAGPGVVLRVSDDGPGIPRDHLPRLTERFYRVDAGRSRAVGGTGLGLAIVKHVVNRHRGKLLIESTEGQGTTVQVWLPQAR